MYFLDGNKKITMSSSETTQCPGAPRAPRVQIGGTSAFHAVTPRSLFHLGVNSERPGAPRKRERPVPSNIENSAVRRRLF